jgi:hypothetical protein
MDIRSEYLIDVISLMPRMSKWFMKSNDDHFTERIRELKWFQEDIYYVIDFAENDLKLIITTIRNFELHDFIEKSHIESLGVRLYESYDYFEYGLLTRTIQPAEHFRKRYIEGEQMCGIAKEW